MHILLTDITTCPRCGPGFGLILMVDEMQERRVRRGSLGCANCREQYRIENGVADLRAPGAEAAAGGAPAAENAPAADDAPATRLAALAGVTQGPAYLLVAGPAAAHATALAELLEDVHVVALHADAAALGEHARVTRALVSGTLPFYSGRMAGVVLSGSAATELLEEGMRVLSPLGRLVLEGAPVDAASRVEAGGLRIAAAADDVLVAVHR